jgi:hypothetical protein
MSLVTPSKIRELQIKLYRKAKNEPGYRFYLVGHSEIGQFPITVGKRAYRVRLNGADHQWGKDPPKEVVG